jgi:hypothetical protein
VSLPRNNKGERYFIESRDRQVSYLPSFATSQTGTPTYVPGFSILVTTTPPAPMIALLTTEMSSMTTAPTPRNTQSPNLLRPAPLE